MNSEWQKTFRDRMHRFEGQYKPPKGSVAISIKVRVSFGCFHREHSPHAYELIDNYLSTLVGQEEFTFEEHESGPELLIYVAAVTAGISLTKSIIDLIVAIIKARSEGIKRGDNPTAPLELIIRRVHKNGEFKEETILRIDHRDTVTRSMIEKHFKDSSGLMEEEKPKSTNKSLKRVAAKKRRAP